MAKLPAWLQVIANFARFTGARRGEILNLTWNDVDYKRGLLNFRETKNGEDGRVKMNATVTRLLKSLPAPIDRSQRVFQLENRPPVWTRIGHHWSKAVKEARIEDYHFHDLRHQAATDLLTLGANLNDVRDFLRHKSLVMTLRYGHLVEDRRKDTACLLDQLGAGPLGVKKGLESYLPVPRVMREGDRFHWVEDFPKTIGRLHAFYGNFGVTLRAFAYILTNGPEGLRQVAEGAVLNANYLRSRLEDQLALPFPNRSLHEVVFSDRNLQSTGVRTIDIAKRLIDYGFHPPTI